MKKSFLLLGVVLGLGLCVGLGTGHSTISAFAEGEEEVVEPAKETYTISFTQPEHGKITIDEADLEGEVGKEVQINVDPSMFYLVESVVVNDSVTLVESDTTKGLYTFTPAAGENIITVKIVADSALIEEFNAIAQKVKNKDWESIFSVETVTRLVGIVLNSGLLVAIVCYFIKDKRLSKAVGDKVEKSMKELVPDQTKEAVLKAVEEQITPIFEENKANAVRMMQALAVFSKCMALAQENTAESKKAILDELTALEIGDMATIAEIKDYIHKEIAAKQKEYEENMAAIRAIEEKNAKNTTKDAPVEVNSTKEEQEDTHTEEHNYDGTEI